MEATAPRRAPVSSHVPIMSNFFSNRFSSLRLCANAVWKLKFNGYCNECWLSRSEKREGRRLGTVWEEVCLDAPVSSGFTRRNDLGETCLYIFFSSAFSRTQGSRLLQQGRALPWLASLEGFLQATSRLFGCHWDCLKRICFCTILQGVLDQEKGEKKDHPWALDIAVMHLSILRLKGWANVCKLGVGCICQPQMWVDLWPGMPLSP